MNIRSALLLIAFWAPFSQEESLAKKKSPAFQFYADAWLASTDIQLMSPAEEGAYIHLLAIAWNQPDCGLPTSDAELALLSRLGKNWPKSRTRILAKFDEIEGRYFNLRLLQERKKQEEHRRASSEGGRKGSDSRWTDKGTHDSLIDHSSQKNDPRDKDISLKQKPEEKKDAARDCDCTELANQLWEIHPYPDNFGGVCGALSKEKYKAADYERFDEMLVTSLRAWVAYWEPTKRFPVGLCKWVQSGDFARKPPTIRHPSAPESKLETAAELRARQEREHADEERQRALRLGKSA